MPSFYCIVNDRIYFTEESDPTLIKSMNLDGSDITEVYRANDTVVAVNISGKLLILAKGVSYDNDGLTLSGAIQIVSLADGLLFFTEDQENMAWSCINLETFETIPTK